jgi:hypothetical protein
MDGVIDDSYVRVLFTTGKTVSYDGEIGAVAGSSSTSNSLLLFTRKHCVDGSSRTSIIHNKF